MNKYLSRIKMIAGATLSVVMVTISGFNVQAAPQVIAMSWAEAKKVVPVGECFVVTDLETGTYWGMKSLGNGNHADVEPWSEMDTRIMWGLWGSHSWDPRPVIIEVGGKTLVASVHNMPHDIETLKTNAMVGHVCMHFPGSTTHNGNQSYEKEHQAAVTRAIELTGATRQ